MPFLVDLTLNGGMLADEALLPPRKLRRLTLHALWNTVTKVQRITHAMIEPFALLEELSIPHRHSITNVRFCGATLRKLYANLTGLTDEGLSSAINLEVLHVANVKGVTTVAPFAVSLRELNASGACGICDIGLAMAADIVMLNVSGNSKVTTVAPFATSLQELDASGKGCGITDHSLSFATSIVRLNVSSNPYVTTAAPFAASLRELRACACGLDEHALATASNIVIMDLQNNRKITTVAPFTTSLRELTASGPSQIKDSSLVTSTKLVTLDASDNPNVLRLPQHCSCCANLVAGGVPFPTGRFAFDNKTVEKHIKFRHLRCC